MMYYEEDVLFALASSIGTPIKIDINTHLATLARFARLCIEVDLTKPLVAKFFLDDKWYLVEYEGIHTICFPYGMYGHRTETCTTSHSTKINSGETHSANGTKNDNSEQQKQAEERKGTTSGKVGEEAIQISGLGHGPSMIVQWLVNRNKFGTRETQKGMQNGHTLVSNRFEHLMSEHLRDTEQGAKHVMEIVNSQSEDSALMRQPNNYSNKQKADKMIRSTSTSKQGVSIRENVQPNTLQSNQHFVSIRLDEIEAQRREGK